MILQTEGEVVMVLVDDSTMWFDIDVVVVWLVLYKAWMSSCRVRCFKVQRVVGNLQGVIVSFIIRLNDKKFFRLLHIGMDNNCGLLLIGIWECVSIQTNFFPIKLGVTFVKKIS